MSNRQAAPPEGKKCQPKNTLLASLAHTDLLRLEPYLETVTLVPGGVLFDVDKPLTRVQFVETGVVALVTVLGNRNSIGVAAVGAEGAVGVATMLLGGDTEICRSQVLVPGSALALEVAAFQDALRQSPKLRLACKRYTEALFVQVLQAVACNRLHTAEQRCAGWLLMCADRTEGDRFELTRERLAEMLGVPHSTVTAIIGKLQQAGLIRDCDSAITVLDRGRLATAACECYRIVRDRNRIVCHR